ncbi:MAG TPA: hypothetical protein VLY63_27095 [Anaerolineae bacterium]|nr:hypothetical protein [Anaerolineae bacterium]
MRKTGLIALLGLALLVLAACEGFSQTGVSSSSQQGMNGGQETYRANRANGTITEDIEVDGATSGLILDASVTLTVGKGSFKIELLGEDEEVTLTLEARDGETVSGQGWMTTDGFGSANYRVTANEAEDVEYRIEYTFR